MNLDEARDKSREPVLFAVLGRFVTASFKFISYERRKIRHSFLIFTISSNNFAPNRKILNYSALQHCRLNNPVSVTRG